MASKLLCELVKIKGGKRLPKGEMLQSETNSHPYIRIRDMGSRYLPRTGLEFVPNHVFPKIKNYIVNRNDVIISIVGTIGLVSVIDEYFDNASQTENCAKLSGLDTVDAQFLYYSLISKDGQQKIAEGTVGAVQPKLPLYNIEKINIYWPVRPERERIVQSISILDDKLLLNTQINQSLEQIAQAIYKSWFVDFDPVKAKIAALATGGTKEEAELAAMAILSGKDENALAAFKNESPVAFAELEQTAALFPAGVQDSVLGVIPVGWQVGKVNDLLELCYGKALKKEIRIEGEYKVYGSGGVTGTHNKALIDGPGVIVGRKGSVGTLYWEDSNFFPIDTVFYVKPSKNVSLSYLFYLLQTLGLDKMNTDAAVPGLNRDNVYRLEIIKPSHELQQHFGKMVSLFRLLVSTKKDSSNSLQQLRDALLPKFLSRENTFKPQPEVPK